MILKDYQCRNCLEISEHLVDGKSMPLWETCPLCGGQADKILTISQTHPVDAAWIGTVREVVDKDSDAPHCREFLRHPTRANYQAWMKGEGIRPLEPGERAKPLPDREAKKQRIKRKLLESHAERNAVEI